MKCCGDHRANNNIYIWTPFAPEIVDHLAAIALRLPSLQDFTKKGMENFLRAIAGERCVSLKVIAQPLRVALTGKTVSPGVDEVMITLGKESVIKRIRKAIVFINSRG